MEMVAVNGCSEHQVSADPLPFARSYQLEGLEKALKQNTIVFLETGTGKTLIAVMLLRSFSYILHKPSPYFAVFLVPQVVLVTQQAEVVKMHTNYKVGMYWGAMGVDYWDAAVWMKEIEKYEVLVMTPAILLEGLRHSFFSLDMIKVLIFDECHHASGHHPYACIMKEFYHPQVHSGAQELPKIFGMTASPIKTKGEKTSSGYWKKIHELESLMLSKVYTCINEAVLAEFVPFSTTKFKYYQQAEIQTDLCRHLTVELSTLKAKHICSLKSMDLSETTTESIRKRISKIKSTLSYCLDELGVWLAYEAAKFISSSSEMVCDDSEIISWGKLDPFGEAVVKNFSLDICQAFAAHMSDSGWIISDDIKAALSSGLLTHRVICLVESLLEYSALQDIRCIIFVERIITTIVLQTLLSEILPKHNSWKTKHIAGNNSGLQNQTRKKQNEIVEEFRGGMVNIIVATSILEEGLDVQSCNLVIRFDPATTVCSFIQSRGRARMQDSHYILMVKSGDISTHSRLENYLKSGNIMRQESLSHASVPCENLIDDLDEEIYRVPSTNAIVTLSSSINLLYFYCSRLPSDGYFKPTPRCEIDKETETCTLHLPKSCPIRMIRVHGNLKTLKKVACLEACRQLHKVGALTDNLVPDIVVEEAAVQESGSEPYNDEQPVYYPPELVNRCLETSKTTYYCYTIEMKQKFDYEVPIRNILLCVRYKLEYDIGTTCFELEFSKGALTVNLQPAGVIELNPEEVLLCRKFQVTIFRVIMNQNLDKVADVLDRSMLRDEIEVDYLLLPRNNIQEEVLIDWSSVGSVLFSCYDDLKDHANCPRVLHTKDGEVCSCMIQNSVVYTPHNGHVYCIDGILDGMNSNSLLKLSDGSVKTYKEYNEKRHGIRLSFGHEPLLKGRRAFRGQNHLHASKKQKDDRSKVFVELPPELCCIVMSPVSISTLYSYVYIPSIMHRIESLLVAANLRKMLMGHCAQNVKIPTMKVLEAITAVQCLEAFHLESLETLGDSFLKYAASQHLFKVHQNDHEGLLSIKKDRIVSNLALTKLGCDRKLPGFIRSESFDLKTWIKPGDNDDRRATLTEESVSTESKMYVKDRKFLKSKRVADVVEALIGVYLSTGGEAAAILFMDWVGIKVDFSNIPYERDITVCAEKLVNVRHLESLLNYTFRNRSLLVEALTHGSYMFPEIPACYQRLEYLGDAVLDYLITVHLYDKYPQMSPGLLSDMRSASVNNECYALSAVKAGLHKNVLHVSHDLHKQISITVGSFENVSSKPTFGWELETSFPKVLGDVIESLAGAIFVDSGYDKSVVFASLRPLLEPLITPETIRLHPVRELNEVCQKHHFEMRKPVKSRKNGMACITIGVEGNGKVFQHTSASTDKKMANKLACKEVLKMVKENM